MITFVYCYICLLIVCCQTASIEDEDHNYTKNELNVQLQNDSPDIVPKVEYFRKPFGADVQLSCNNQYKKDNITWEFKRCQTNYRGTQCDKKYIYPLDDRGNEWKRMEFGQHWKLLLQNVTEKNVGFYRCLYNNSVKKIYIVEILGPLKQEGSPPKVISLLPSSNNTILPNSHLVIQCKVRSVIPPEIRWFKECNGRRCEILLNGHCYCPIQLSNSVYSASNNVYRSKLNIINARNVDSGRYSCFVISLYGTDYKNITIKVQDLKREEENWKSFSLLFAIPLCFVLVPATIWLCFSRRNRKKNCQNFKEHQKQLLKPVVEVDIVVDVDDVV